MSSTALPAIAAVSSATIGGAYLVFSTMVVPALDRLGPSRAADAMRAINVAAERPPFLALFFGSALAAGAVIATSAVGHPSVDGSEDGSRVFRLVGAGLSLAGFATTMVRNVPLNRALAGRAAPDAWDRFRRPWARANGVRAAASIAGAALLVLGTR